MSNLSKSTESFKANYEFFLAGCDSMDQSGKWDRDEYGDMSTFYSGDLVSLIIRLVADDSDITEEQTQFLNNCFGLEYSPEELADFYEMCSYELDEDNDTIFDHSLSALEAVNARLAEAYKFLISTACEIILDSDFRREEDLNIVKHVYDLVQ